MIGSIYQKWSFNIYNAGQMKMKKKIMLGRCNGYKLWIFIGTGDKLQ